MSRQPTSETTISATSLPESEDGRLLFGWPDGRVADPSGQEAVPVSRFRALDSEKAMPIDDTCGPLFNASSPSADLQRSLESRLRARMDVNGSPLYDLTWSEWGMPAGVQICRLRASARRTSGNGFGGWPTPISAAKSNTRKRESALNEIRRGGHQTLAIAAQMAGWGTPNTMDHLPSSNLAERKKKGGCCNLKDQAGWATPTVRDHRDAGSDLTNTPINGLLGRQVSLSHAPTGKRGSLNPVFTRWLMGFPVEWDDCAPTATPLSQVSQRSS